MLVCTSAALFVVPYSIIIIPCALCVGKDTICILYYELKYKHRMNWISLSYNFNSPQVYKKAIKPTACPSNFLHLFCFSPHWVLSISDLSLLIQCIIISMTASFFCPFMSRGCSVASFITLSASWSSYVTLSHPDKIWWWWWWWGVSDLEAASNWLGSMRSLSQRWLRHQKKGSGGETGRERGKRRRKLGLITSCIFKQAHSPCRGESSIFGETHEKGGDMRRQRERRRSRLVKWS